MDKLTLSTIIIAIITGLPATLIALATLITAIRNSTKTAELAKSVDGHMTTLIEQTKTASKAEGKAEGTVEGIIKGVELNKPLVIQDRRGESK
jgi:hypothetical protein